MVKLDYKPEELNYAATSRCLCGAGLAYHEENVKRGFERSWTCSKLLKGEVAINPTLWQPYGFMGQQIVAADNETHVSLPFMTYEIKSERQPSARRLNETTRPDDEAQALSYEEERAIKIQRLPETMREFSDGLIEQAISGNVNDEWIFQFGWDVPTRSDVAKEVKTALVAALRHVPMPTKLVGDLWSVFLEAQGVEPTNCKGCKGKLDTPYLSYARGYRWHSECIKKIEEIEKNLGKKAP